MPSNPWTYSLSDYEEAFDRASESAVGVIVNGVVFSSREVEDAAIRGVASPWRGGVRLVSGGVNRFRAEYAVIPTDIHGPLVDLSGKAAHRKTGPMQSALERRDELETRVKFLEGLLRKYIQHVKNNSGQTHLGTTLKRYADIAGISPAEWAELERLAGE